MKIANDLVFPCLEGTIRFRLSSLVKNRKGNTEQLTLFPLRNNSSTIKSKSTKNGTNDDDDESKTTSPLPIANVGVYPTDSKNKKSEQEWMLIPQSDGISYAIQSSSTSAAGSSTSGEKISYYLSCNEDGFVTIEDTMDSSEQLWKLERIENECNQNKDKNNSIKDSDESMYKNNFIFKFRSKAYPDRILSKIPGLAYENNKGTMIEAAPFIMTVQDYEIKQGSKDKEGQQQELYLTMWKMEFVTGELVFLSNTSFNRRLRCDVFGKINVDKNWKGWEIFRFIEAGNTIDNHVYISSWTHDTKFLACHPNGTIQTIEQSEKENIEDIAVPYVESNSNDDSKSLETSTGISSAATPSSTVGVRWKLSKKTSNGIVLQSVEHGYYLCVRGDSASSSGTICTVKSPYVADLLNNEDEIENNLKFIQHQGNELERHRRQEKQEKMKKNVSNVRREEEEDDEEEEEHEHGPKEAMVIGVEWTLHAGHCHIFYITARTGNESSDMKDGIIKESDDDEGSTPEPPKNVFVSSKPNGEVALSDNRKRWEEWKIGRAGDDFVDAGKNGLYYIYSQKHERYLGVSAVDGHLRTAKEMWETELWDIELDDVDGGYIISSHATGRHLIIDAGEEKATDGSSTTIITTSEDEFQSWTLDPRVTRAYTGSQLAMMSGAGVAAAALCAAAPFAVVWGVQALGFGSTGIAAGSTAASMMSAEAVASGGTIAAGGTVATLQSIGAAGLGAASTTAAMGGGALLGTAVVGTTAAAVKGQNERQGSQVNTMDNVDKMNEDDEEKKNISHPFIPTQDGKRQQQQQQEQQRPQRPFVAWKSWDCEEK